MTKIAITTTSFGKDDPSPLTLCREKGLEVVLNPYGRKLKTEELKELARGATGLIAGTEAITEDALLALRDLKVISRCGTGLDNVDLKAAERLGIKVFNTPDAPTQAVAELAVGLMLNLLRKVGRMDRAVRAGQWEKLMGNLLSEKTVGIIGLGRIGGRVAELLGCFGCKIKYYDRREGDLSTAAQRVGLDELFRTCDIISVHVSSTERIIADSEIGSMKRGAWLINVSRGGVVCENALYDALREGRLSGAAIDVFEVEPCSDRFKDLENIVLTPHIGSYAHEARVQMEMLSVSNLLKGLEIE
jgi:D-3-phosphoglycerate dehydrogenase